MNSSYSFTLYLDDRLLSTWRPNEVGMLARLCEKFAGTDYSIEIRRVKDDRQRAFHDGVVTTPAILLELNGGRKKLLGSFAEAEKYLERNSVAIDPAGPIFTQLPASPLSIHLNTHARFLLGRSTAAEKRGWWAPFIRLGSRSEPQAGRSAAGA